jgi:hypothetical protein
MLKGDVKPAALMEQGKKGGQGRPAPPGGNGSNNNNNNNNNSGGNGKVKGWLNTLFN